MQLIGLSIIIFHFSFCSLWAQSKLYPQHFDLTEVTLLDGPMKTALERNNKTLLEYDADRLLTPFIMQAKLHEKPGRYWHWDKLHPNFKNWGGDGFDLSGHVGGHYVSALALAIAATHDDKTTQKTLHQRLDYMLQVLKDCQDAYKDDTTGLRGFIGGQPILDVWRAMWRGDIAGYMKCRGWVPLYCQHKVLAGLRDAYVYAGSKQALGMFRQLADWSANLISRLDDKTMDTVLKYEHGGINESMADAYALFGDPRYLEAARRYSHREMVEGMQTLDTVFLDGKHANTQVPKYIGFERVGTHESTTAARNFWQDVATNRTVCIGGNSMKERFIAASAGHRYITVYDGPESCNTNNMLKLSEMLFDDTHDSRYADFYEAAVWNHILSTQDPETGGYVYFTTLRPQGYRIYSQVNQGMWCCVGTGMENHSKYGHFVYTHDGKERLYVNLFTPSRLESKHFDVTQETRFPFDPQTKLTIGRPGTFALSIRKPAWCSGFAVSVNGEPLSTADSQFSNGYISINRSWRKGDVVEISLPMTLRCEECPNLPDYVAFKYGPVLLGAAVGKDETLPNEYAGEGRMDHAPGSRAAGRDLNTAPLLLCPRSDVHSLIRPADSSKLQFTITVPKFGEHTNVSLTLQPFWQIHHSRYMCYWYQQPPEVYAQSRMAREKERLSKEENHTDPSHQNN